MPTIDDYDNQCVGSWCGIEKEPSIMLKIGNSSEPAIVFSAHFDTWNSTSYSPPRVKPGADDNVSGTVVLMEAARTILSSKYQFKKPMYFIWDAGEESEQIGLNDIIYHYFQEGNVPVSAVLNYDETGWANNNDPSIIVQKNSDSLPKAPYLQVADPELTDFLTQLITQYLNVPVKYTNNYYNTDAADWNMNGYKVDQASDGYEGTANEPFHVHSSDDTMSNLSLARLTQFAKLAVAFGVELAEPVK